MLPEAYQWPINDMWAVHDYQSDGPQARCPQYTRRISDRYGEPSGLEDYCRKAQMVNLESAKAIYECLQANQTGALLIWMTQAAWPSLICQLYDYYFEPTAAYFGAKKGCEPIHILWDSHAGVIKAANNTALAHAGLTAEAQVFDLAGHTLWRKSVGLDLPATSVRDCFPILRPTNSVFFVKLVLRHGHEPVSDNFYWQCPIGGNCQALSQMPTVELVAAAESSRINGAGRLSVRVRNSGKDVGLAIRLKVVRARSGERVLPVFYEDNYFSLLPGEERNVNLEFSTADLHSESPRLLVEGWNIAPHEIPIK